MCHMPLCHSFFFHSSTDIMPVDTFSDIARQQTLGATFSRIMARSKGIPVPLISNSIVKNEPTGKGWTMYKDYPRDFSWMDNLVIATCLPVVIPFGMVIGVCRLLRYMK